MSDTKPLDLNNLLDTSRATMMSPEEVESLKKEFLERYVTVLKMSLEKCVVHGHRLEFGMTRRELAELFRVGHRDLYNHTALYDFFCDFTKNPKGYLEQYIEGEFEMQTILTSVGDLQWDTTLLFSVRGAM